MFYPKIDSLISRENFSRLGINMAAIFLFIASASELWISSDNSILNTIAFQPISSLCIFILCLLLLSLHYQKWHEKRNIKHSRKRLIFYSIISTFVNLIFIYLMFLLTYFSLNELNSKNIYHSIKLLYLIVPFAVGEFSLVSYTSNQLKRAKKLNMEINETAEHIESSIAKIDEFMLKWEKSRTLNKK